ncbi:thiosulfate oxidation carrier protein SoxY [Magnetovibrio blakemorei]|uniref:Thiosulfate oxidation carrier protein SoxY n=1 Tax=Magnetovibrio blakemorei TaxID=28181 RepID=A0A1E5Q719_9PROT|nr:thiosulfate oxidation carrier protein SoxY [Magnetovibrio blakemorei]OEJ66875.1 thiosulfate oxidation carrier protein SoxY [Magnetovibrio blakemorei]
MSNTNSQLVRMDRRTALKAAGAGFVALGFASTAHASPEAAAEALAKLSGGAAAATSDKITISLPEIAENGATVPVGITVDSPMTAASYVKQIHVFAEGNPSPETITFNLTPTGTADVNTRIRLSKTQNVLVAAVMNDGSVLTNKKEVKVTIGGCGG